MSSEECVLQKWYAGQQAQAARIAQETQQWISKLNAWLLSQNLKPHQQKDPARAEIRDVAIAGGCLFATLFLACPSPGGGGSEEQQEHPVLFGIRVTQNEIARRLRLSSIQSIARVLRHLKLYCQCPLPSTIGDKTSKQQQQSMKIVSSPPKMPVETKTIVQNISANKMEEEDLDVKDEDPTDNGKRRKSSKSSSSSRSKMHSGPPGSKSTSFNKGSRSGHAGRRRKASKAFFAHVLVADEA